MHAASTLISLAVVRLAIAPVFLLHVLLGLLRAARSILPPGFITTKRKLTVNGIYGKLRLSIRSWPDG